MTDKLLIERELLEELRDAANEAHNEATRPYRMKFFAALVEKADAILAAPRQPPVQDSCVRCGKETVCGKTHCEACCYEPISAPQPSDDVAKDAWIPVGERLPEYGQEVIVNADFDGVCAGVLDSYDEWFAPCSEYKLTRITHWMPLPAAPAIAAARQEGGKV